MRKVSAFIVFAVLFATYPAAMAHTHCNESVNVIECAIK